MNEINKTNVINTQTYDEITPSYKWENPKCKNTFPPGQWVGAILDFLYNKFTTTEIEKRYVKSMIKITKSTNNMYINSLLRKIQISSKQNFKEIQKHFNEDDLEKWIIKQINSITEKHYELAVNKGKKMIDEWREYYHNNYQNINWKTNEDIVLELKKTIKKNGYTPWEQIKLKKNIHKVKLTNNPQGNFDNETIKEEIGETGESHFYDSLVNKYGNENVIWMKHINKYAPYDFVVEHENKKHYYEVKSTNKNSLRFHLSRNEYEFWKVCKKENNDYSLISIKNIYLKKLSHIPIIEECLNPNFIISLKHFGSDGENIIITPYKYKGLL